MKPIDEKMRRAVVELSMDNNFQTILGWMISGYMESLIACTVIADPAKREFFAGKAAARGEILNDISELAGNKEELKKTTEAYIMKKMAFI